MIDGIGGRYTSRIGALTAGSGPAIGFWHPTEGTPSSSHKIQDNLRRKVASVSEVVEQDNSVIHRLIFGAVEEGYRRMCHHHRAEFLQ